MSHTHEAKDELRDAGEAKPDHSPAKRVFSETLSLPFSQQSVIEQ